jgi:hypothetical protein
MNVLSRRPTVFTFAARAGASIFWKSQFGGSSWTLHATIPSE